MGQDGMRRFGRLARKVVRDHVREHGEPPRLTLWASRGPNPRQCVPYEIGRARDEHQVRQHGVDALHEAQSRWCAIGRMQKIVVPVDPEDPDTGFRYEDTNQFGLIVLGAGETPALLEVEIVNGHVGAWRPWEPLALGDIAARQAMIDTFRFAQATLERIARAQADLAGGPA